eukprot:gene8088-23497_t
MVAIGIATYGVCWVAWRVKKTASYWSACKADVLETPGVLTNLIKGPLRWFCINDVIMGGRSESRIATENGKLVFVGNISTVGGGFASIRTTETTLVAMPQGAAGAIKVVVEGDGQMWKVTLGVSHGLMSGEPTWTHDFLTQKGVTTTHTLPLSAFTPQRRGRKVGSPTCNVAGAKLVLSDVCYVGLILSLVDQEGKPNAHFGDGPFKLILHSLEAE